MNIRSRLRRLERRANLNALVKATPIDWEKREAGYRWLVEWLATGNPMPPDEVIIEHVLFTNRMPDDLWADVIAAGGPDRSGEPASD